jgi:hypothetical protein
MIKQKAKRVNLSKRTAKNKNQKRLSRWWCIARGGNMYRYICTSKDTLCKRTKLWRNWFIGAENWCCDWAEDGGSTLYICRRGKGWVTVSDQYIEPCLELGPVQAVGLQQVAHALPSRQAARQLLVPHTQPASRHHWEDCLTGNGPNMVPTWLNKEESADGF